MANALGDFDMGPSWGVFAAGGVGLKYRYFNAGRYHYNDPTSAPSGQTRVISGA
ncbi:MAG: hypothetical protein RIS94_626 [Pseudomonadota bacterium]|jgi:hypothetical protein